MILKYVGVQILYFALVVHRDACLYNNLARETTSPALLGRRRKKFDDSFLMINGVRF